LGLTLDSHTESLDSFGIILIPFGLSGVRKKQIQVLAGSIYCNVSVTMAHS
jgi:hypothetical protein